jgi:hypothetical protein
MKPIILAIAFTLSVLCVSAAADKKSCEELKTEIAAKLDAKGVKGYTLTIVGKDEVKDEKVVGSCEGGEKRITYTRK